MYKYINNSEDLNLHEMQEFDSIYQAAYKTFQANQNRELYDLKESNFDKAIRSIGGTTDNVYYDYDTGELYYYNTNDGNVYKIMNAFNKSPNIRLNKVNDDTIVKSIYEY